MTSGSRSRTPAVERLPRRKGAGRRCWPLGGGSATVVALPSTKATKHRHRPFTLNVSNIEVLVAHCDPVSGEESAGFRTVDDMGSRRIPKASVENRDLYPAPYATSGGKAMTTVFEDLDDLMTMLSLPLIQDAARCLNDRLRSSLKSHPCKGSGTCLSSSTGSTRRSSRHIA